MARSDLRLSKFYLYRRVKKNWNSCELPDLAQYGWVALLPLRREVPMGKNDIRKLRLRPRNFLPSMLWVPLMLPEVLAPIGGPNCLAVELFNVFFWPVTGYCQPFWFCMLNLAMLPAYRELFIRYWQWKRPDLRLSKFYQYRTDKKNWNPCELPDLGQCYQRASCHPVQKVDERIFDWSPSCVSKNVLF